MADAMISHRLDIALQETIRAHADQHHHGAQVLEHILSALGEIASARLAEVPRPQRRALFNAICIGIGKATNAKARDQALAVALIS